MNAGYLIPKDWCVMASLTSVHMDEKNYENPFKFDPWRWEVIQLLKLYLVMFIFKQGSHIFMKQFYILCSMLAENWCCG
jgi:cytochrome P450